jgi:MYXO-CTERM domain-containing protein
MKRILILVLSVVALISSLVLVTTAVASADGSQRWDLDGDSHPDYGDQYLMEKPAVSSPSGSVSISNGEEAIWLSGNYAEVNVTFQDGSWAIVLDTGGATWAKGDFGIEVGSFNPSSSTFNKFATWTGTDIQWPGGLLRVEIESSPATVSQDHFLALKVINNSGGDYSVVTGGDSFVSSPESDPGYPLPEVAAGVLLALGLGGLGGYVAIRRKRAREVNDI